MLEEFDYSYFKADVHEWSGTDEFFSAPRWADGIHRVGLPTHHMDLLFKNDVLGSNQDYILVTFNGAVSKRGERKPPFFSGMNLGRELDGPFVAVADTSLALSPDLNIGWYAGYQDGQFQDAILRTLRTIAERTGKHLWLVGGSAGGFAALYYGHLLGDDASVLVWNPQTDFLEYSPPLVRPYLEQAFPQLVATGEPADHPRGWAGALERAGVQHSIMAQVRKGHRPRRMLVLQNWNDWHVEAHLAPLMRAYGASPVRRNLYEAGPEHAFWIRNLGEGHVPPTPAHIVELLGALWAEGGTLRQTVGTLEDLGLTAEKDISSFPFWGLGREAAVARALDWGSGDGGSLCPAIPGVPAKSKAFMFSYRVRAGERTLRETSALLGSRLVLSALPDWSDVEVSVGDGFGNPLFTTTFFRGK